MLRSTLLSWTVNRLKRELNERGASARGRKADLIERILAYDRNENFQSKGVLLIPEPEPLDLGWPVSGFQQLRTDHRIFLPKLNFQQIEEYFLYRLAGDRQGAADIKSIKNGRLLFEGRRCLACSINVQSSIYLSGIVGATMKNKVFYNFKLRLDKITGDPLNSHCECPAGKGPNATCKHLAAILLMFGEFTSGGEIVVGRSCTETLQTFHKPKVTYTGNPVKATDLPVKRKYLSTFMDDPRPIKFRRMAGYNDHVRNTLINHCSVSSQRFAFLYLYKKADIQTATKDHDYLPLPYTEYWVDRALQVTATETASIEEHTRGQSSNKLWFSERRWRLTASRFGEICKITFKRNIPKLCASLVSPTMQPTKAMLHGKNYEGKALKAFEKKVAITIKPCGLFISSSHPYLGATPDGIIDKESLIEIKCPYNGRNSPVRPGPNFPFLQVD